MKEMNIGDTYWLGSLHVVDKRTWVDSDFDKWSFNSGDIFKSNRQAQANYDKLRKRLDEVRSRGKQEGFIAMNPGEKIL